MKAAIDSFHLFLILFYPNYPFSAKSVQFLQSVLIIDRFVLLSDTEVRFMVGRAAVRMIKQMTREGLIEVPEQEHYVYALITLAESAITICAVMGLSLVVGRGLETVAFLAFFYALRKRTGGFHMWSFSKCLVGTLGIYIVVVGFMPDLVEHPSVLFGSLAVAMGILECVGTVNHPNMNYNSQELSEMKKAARSMTMLEVGIILFCYYLKVDMYLIGYMCSGVILCAILVCVAKICRQEVKKR